MTVYSLYVHIPFCRHKCSYCDFNTYVGIDGLHEEYVRAVCREANLLAEAAGTHLHVGTLFFGGGTPSVLPIPQLAKIISVLNKNFDLQRSVEITFEANPESLSISYLEDLKGLGVNRVSLGMQSAYPEELSLLARQHDFFDVIDVVRWINRAQIPQFNVDLIFGLPQQTFESWRRTLDLTVKLNPHHLSLYALSLEGATPMRGWVDRGFLSSPDPDLAAEMYEWASHFLDRKGYRQYEISNWARMGASGAPLVCRHNMQYWRNLPYLGLGAGAHGFAGGERIANACAPADYIQRCLHGPSMRFPHTPATASAERVDPFTEMQETLLMGLRLTEEGVSARRFQSRFGRTLKGVFDQELTTLVDSGLLEWGGEGGDRLRLTPRGRLLGNQVFMRFV